MTSNAYLWQKFNESQDETAKQELVVAYLHLVKHIAGRLSVKLPAHINHDDLESCGVLGLLEAIDKYNSSQGTDFETFAYRRIQGAMYDELRKANWIPRTAWHKLNQLYKARNTLENELGRSVSDKELVEHLGISMKELHKLNNLFTQLTALSLDRLTGEDNGQAISFTDILPDPLSPDPLQEVCSNDDRETLIEAVKLLSERDQLILSLYYQEELTLKEIGQVLEITESRVCQLHSRAISRLRKKLKGLM